MSQAGIADLISNNPSIPTQFDADTSFAIPIANNLDIKGTAAQGISTVGDGLNKITITAANATTASKGVAQFDPAGFSVTAGVVSLIGGGGTVTSVSGTANRITSTGGATPVIDISASYVGQSSITTLGTITTGVWSGTIVTVAKGGTGVGTLTGVLTGNGTGNVTANAVTQYGVVIGGASNAVASTAVGSAGQILRSGGAGVNPSYSVPTFPVTASAASRKMIVSDGTNWVASTETYAVPGTSGNVLTSDGTNWTSASVALPGQLNVAAVTLTSAQIKTIHGTPYVLVAAPGVGKTIIVVSAWANFVYGGSNVFSVGGSQSISLYYGTSGTAASLATASSLGPNTLIGSSATVIMAQSPLISAATTGTTRTVLQNTALNVYNPVVTEIAGNAANDNTMTFTVLYYIATL